MVFSVMFTPLHLCLVNTLCTTSSNTCLSLLPWTCWAEELQPTNLSTTCLTLDTFTVVGLGLVEEEERKSKPTTGELKVMETFLTHSAGVWDWHGHSRDRGHTMHIILSQHLSETRIRFSHSLKFTKSYDTLAFLPTPSLSTAVLFFPVLRSSGCNMY